MMVIRADLNTNLLELTTVQRLGRSFGTAGELLADSLLQAAPTEGVLRALVIGVGHIERVTSGARCRP
jgi:hypothetical protein